MLRFADPENLSRKILVAIVLIFVALGIFYNLTTPILETPDEVWHYAYVRELAIYHRLPIVDAEGKAPYRHEGLQPPLYYALGSAFITWMNAADVQTLLPPNPFTRIGDPRADNNDNRNAFLHTADEQFPFHGTALAVHLIRLYSTILGALTIIATFLLAREIAPNHSTIALGAAAYVGFLPQFVFISSAISNDNLATLLTVTALYQLVRITRHGLNYPRAAFLAVLVGAALLTKLTTIALTPLVLLVLAYILFKERNWRTVIVSGFIFGGIVALIAGWWYIRNLFLYGDFTTFGILAVLVGERSTPMSFWRWFSAESEGLRLSAWGMFGWFNIRASTWFYDFFDALALLGLIGIGIGLIVRRNFSLGLAILALWCGLIFFALWNYASIIITSQGRLLFPALPAWAILWSGGIAALTPTRVRSWITLVIASIQVVIAALVPIMFIAPAYTPTVVNAIPQRSIPLDWKFDNGVEWLAASLDKTSIRPGEELKVTLYQKSPAGKIPSSAIFIHVINSADVIVAQRDSLIGSGNPINQSTSVIIADVYTVPIPVTAPAPDEWHIQVGMYDPASGKRSQVTNQKGDALGDEVKLTTWPAASALADAWNFDFDGHITLANAEITQNSVTRGGTMNLTLYWRNAPNISRALNVFVHALGENERMWAANDVALDPAQPTQINLQFDPATPPGVYRLELGVYPPPDGSRFEIFDGHGQAIGDRIFLGPIRIE